MAFSIAGTAIAFQRISVWTIKGFKVNAKYYSSVTGSLNLIFGIFLISVVVGSILLMHGINFVLLIVISILSFTNAVLGIGAAIVYED